MGYFPILDVKTSNSRDSDILLRFNFWPRNRQRNFSVETVVSPKSNAATFRSVSTPQPILPSDLPIPKHGLIMDVDTLNSHGEKLQNTVSRILAHPTGEWRLAG